MEFSSNEGQAMKVIDCWPEVEFRLNCFFAGSTETPVVCIGVRMCADPPNLLIHINPISCTYFFLLAKESYLEQFRYFSEYCTDES